jgi:hypothetical protein
MAKAFKFKNEEIINSLKVFGWSFGSALVALLIDVLANLDVNSEYLFLVSIINTILYAIKEFLTNNKSA